jgi:hypothetical protein
VVGAHCPTNKGVSYTNLVSGLAVTLKIDYYYYYYKKRKEKTQNIYGKFWKNKNK